MATDTLDAPPPTGFDGSLNSIVGQYRKTDQGKVDPKDDYTLTQEFGDYLSQTNPAIFDQYPDFGESYRQVREANAPSLAGEAWRGLKRGAKGLGATAEDIGALAISPFAPETAHKLVQSAKELEQPSPDEAPTIPSVSDIAPGSSTLGKIFSKDTARYLLGKTGEALPSLGEAVLTGAAGAAVGSAIGPEGTVAGAAEGVVGKSAVKALLRKYAAELAAGGNMYGLSAGQIYGETENPGLALGLGAVAAVPATVLPVKVLKGLFPTLEGKVAQDAGNTYVKRLATNLLKDAGIGGGATGFQEAVSTIASKLNSGQDPTSFSDDDWKRVREAATGGGLAGAMVAPITAREGAVAPVTKQEPVKTPPIQPTEARKAIVNQLLTGQTSPQVAAKPSLASVMTAVAQMTPEEQQVRLATLAQSSARTPLEESEYQVLQAQPKPEAPTPTLQGETSPTAPVITPDTTPEILPTPAPEATRPTQEQITAPTPETPAPPIEEAIAPVIKDSLITQPPVAETVPQAVPIEQQSNVPPQPTPPPKAPVEFVENRTKGKLPPVEIYKLTEDIPGHNKGDEISRGTLEKLGYEVSAPDVQLTHEDAGYASRENMLQDYKQNGQHDVFETQEEFLKRMHCTNQ